AWTAVLRIRRSCRRRDEECTFENIQDWLLVDTSSQIFAVCVLALIAYSIWVAATVLAKTKDDDS
ncbi:MAG: hypothetical protein AAFY15_04755, partial [Cyanobacteria bacterium J06648_11]